MSVTRRKPNVRHVAHAALMASASFLSLSFASEAQAQCVANPAQPVGAITTDGTVVTCTGTSSGQVVTATANQVEINVATGAAVNGGSVIFAIGDQNTVRVRNGAVFDASTIYLQGQDGQVFIDGSSTAAGITVQGDGSDLFIGQTANVTIAPTNLAVLASTPTGINTIGLAGTLTGSMSNGGYLIGAGDGKQRLFLQGNLVVQSDGLAVNLGDGNDEIFIAAGASITGGNGFNILLAGGAGNDLMQIDGSGTTSFNTTGIERLVLNAGAGGFRVVTGSHANVAEFQVASGTVRVNAPVSLGASNSNVTVFQDATLLIGGASNQTYANNFGGVGTIILGAPNTTTFLDGNWSQFTGTFVIDQLNFALFQNSTIAGSGTIINNGTIEFGDFTLGNAISGTGQVIKDGSATGFLTGNNTFSGGLRVEGGILEVASVNALGTGVITANGPGGSLALNIGGNQTLANNITGNVGLIKLGAGVLDLTGTNTYAGGTTINAGAVRVDDLARLGTGQVTANAGGSLILSYAGAGQLLQTTPFLTGAGAFIKEGSGDVVISAANTYTGGTTIRAGRLGLNNGDALGTGAIQIDGGAELGIGGIILNNDLTGAGLVRKTANNTAELYGDNSGFTGTLRVEDGDILVTNGNALGSGTLQINSGASVFVNAVADFDHRRRPHRRWHLRESRRGPRHADRQRLAIRRRDWHPERHAPDRGRPEHRNQPWRGVHQHAGHAPARYRGQQQPCDRGLW